MALVKINGRDYFFPCGEISINKIGAGRYTVRYDDRDFEILGGLESGGAANEWFCFHPEFYGETWVASNSMVQAIKTGVQF